MKKSLFKEENKGFSLVELIIVIAIMAILTGAIAPALVKYVKKARKEAYLDTADTIQLAVEAMLVEAGKDGYSIVGISYNGSNDGSTGTGSIYCKTESGVSDISDSSVKEEYFSEMLNTASLGKYILSSSNGVPMKLAFNDSGALAESNSSAGITETYILLSDKSNDKKAKLIYTAEDGWVISEEY